MFKKLFYILTGARFVYCSILSWDSRVFGSFYSYLKGMTAQIGKVFFIDSITNFIDVYLTIIY